MAISFLLGSVPLIFEHLPTQAAEQAETLMAIPNLVLVGTDLINLDQFAPMELPQPLEATYRAEQGGAVLSLHIAAKSGNRWTVRRTYEEPDLGVETKVYLVERRGQALVSIEDYLEARGSEAGLLVFEANSGSSSIPPEYWIRYFRMP